MLALSYISGVVADAHVLRDAYQNQSSAFDSINEQIEKALAAKDYETARTLDITLKNTLSSEKLTCSLLC